MAFREEANLKPLDFPDFIIIAETAPGWARFRPLWH
jgi:hypothetical protein